MADLQFIIKKLDQHAQRLGSQAALAETLDVSRSFVSAVMKGKKKPTKEMLELVGYREVVSYEKITP